MPGPWGGPPLWIVRDLWSPERSGQACLLQSRQPAATGTPGRAPHPSRLNEAQLKSDPSRPSPPRKAIPHGSDIVCNPNRASVPIPSFLASAATIRPKSARLHQATSHTGLGRARTCSPSSHGCPLTVQVVGQIPAVTVLQKTSRMSWSAARGDPAAQPRCPHHPTPGHLLPRHLGQTCLATLKEVNRDAHHPFSPCCGRWCGKPTDTRTTSNPLMTRSLRTRRAQPPSPHSWPPGLTSMTR